MDLPQIFTLVSCTLSYLQGGDDFIPHLLDRYHIAAGLGVDDAFLLLPSHHDGLLAVCCAAHLFLLTLRGQRGVGVGRDHGRDWCKNKVRGREEIIVLDYITGETHRS